MTHRNNKSFLALALLGAIALAPAAQAAEINRNTGVGLEIAAQGNAALRYIRANLHILAPSLSKARVMKMSTPRPVAPGGVEATAATLRCAE